MRLEIAKEGVFTPKFNRNRELPAADQITVRYHTPTVSMKSRCRKKPQTKGIAASNGSIDHVEILVERDETATLREMLVSISNCSYGRGGEKDHVIASAQDLIGAPIEFEPLLKEIVEEFDRLLDYTEISEKN